jgi:hypothetical protein
VQGYASGFLPTPPHDDAVASGSELAPPLPPGDFHPQSIAHAGRTQDAAFGGADAGESLVPLACPLGPVSRAARGLTAVLARAGHARALRSRRETLSRTKIGKALLTGMRGSTGSGTMRPAIQLSVSGPGPSWWARCLELLSVCDLDLILDIRVVSCISASNVASYAEDGDSF